MFIVRHSEVWAKRTRRLSRLWGKPSLKMVLRNFTQNHSLLYDQILGTHETTTTKTCHDMWYTCSSSRMDLWDVVLAKAIREISPDETRYWWLGRKTGRCSNHKYWRISWLCFVIIVEWEGIQAYRAPWVSKVETVKKVTRLIGYKPCHIMNTRDGVV